MVEVVDRFATSTARIAILRGLLEYRAELAKQGVTQGFQWLDGSFLEQKELLENAAPNDVDAVTFHRLPAGVDEATFLLNNPGLFDHAAVKARYRVDGYSMVLGVALDAPDVRLISYWYSMWSHRRTGLWKGFIETPLSAVDDGMAVTLLNQIEQGGVHP